jgi:hypothetical protein
MAGQGGFPHAHVNVGEINNDALAGRLEQRFLARPHVQEASTRQRRVAGSCRHIRCFQRREAVTRQPGDVKPPWSIDVDADDRRSHRDCDDVVSVREAEFETRIRSAQTWATVWPTAMDAGGAIEDDRLRRCARTPPK